MDNEKKVWFKQFRGTPCQHQCDSVFKGRVWKFGDNIDTDQIYPGKYLPLTDKEEIAKHAMEGVTEAEEFMRDVKDGDIMVVGKNFGCGSSREHAPVSIKGRGITLIIAESFARIFYRNCINTALSILECKDAKKLHQGDEIEANIRTGEIKNLTTKERYNAQPISGLEMEIMESGGLLEYLEKREEK